MSLAPAYVSNDRFRALVWHLLSFAHIPIERHDEAEGIVQQEVDEFLEEVTCLRYVRLLDATPRFKM